MTRILVVIPCLNEEEHIGPLLAQLGANLPTSASLVVADGGSTDATRAIVERAAREDVHGRIALLHNPRRIQSAGVNAAVAAHGEGHGWLLRIDAHCRYPDDYARTLVEDARTHGADAVVVSMATRGVELVQRANAAAQNSPIGNGGSPHRGASAGRWVDHGHHALMSLAAFQAVGGYDETFTHNEDAELDHRLRAAGFRIFLSGRTRCIYFPRKTLPALFRQYVNYGAGRARTVLKHRAVPKLRQMIPLMVVPTLALVALALVTPLALVPATVWVAACLLTGAALAWRARAPDLALAGVSAMLMHLGWSWGFWRQLLSGRR